MAVVDLGRLPRETSVRFGMVVLASVALALSIAEDLWYSTHLSDASRTALHCLALGSPRAYADCQRSPEHGRVLWTVAAAAVVVVVGIVGAVAGSALRRRGLQLAPVVALNVSVVVEPVYRMAGGAPVPLVWRERRPITLARADGVTRPYIEIGAGWMSLAVTDPPRARAVLWHEWHHLRSRDVLPSRVTLWLPSVVMVFVLIDVVASAVGGTSGVWPVLVRALLTVLLLTLARFAVLRARENAADLAAAQWEPDGVRGWLDRPPATLPIVRRAWRALVDPHPSVAQRARVVADPAVSCRLRIGDGLLIGLTAAVGGPVLSRIWRSWFQYGDPAYWAELIGFGMVGAVLGLWLVLLLARAVAAARASGHHVRTGRFSAVLGLSVVVGQLFFANPAVLSFQLPSVSAYSVLGGLVVVAALMAMTAWLRWAVEWWWDCVSDVRPRWWPLGAVGLLTGAGVLGVCGNLLYLSAQSPQEIADASAVTGVPLDGSLLTIYQYFLTVASSDPARVVLAGGVLVALLFLFAPVRRVGGLPAWLLPGPTDPDITQPLRITGSPRRARRPWRWPVGVGVGGGIVAAAAIVAVRAWGPQPVNWFDTQLFVSLPALTAAAVITAGALLVAAKTLAPSLLAGLTAGIGAAVAALGWVTVSTLDGGHFTLSLVLLIFAEIGAFAVFGALLLSGIMPRGRPDRTGAAQPGNSPDPAPSAPVIIAGMLVPLVVVAVGAVALAQPPDLARDRAELNSTWAQLHDEIGIVNFACFHPGVNEVALRVADRVLAELRDPAFQPVSPVLVEIQQEYVAGIADCQAGFTAALVAGSTSVPPALQASAQVHAERCAALIGQLPP